MSAVVLTLDDFRRTVPEILVCLWCAHERSERVIPGRDYYPCPKCDETASLPLHRLGRL